jgi:hypothetical protein
MNLNDPNIYVEKERRYEIRKTIKEKVKKIVQKKVNKSVKLDALTKS